MPALRTLLLASVATAAVVTPASAAAPPQLDPPKGCVPADGALTVGLAPGSSSGVRAVTFSVDGRHASTDATAPFRRTLALDALAPQTLHQVRARVTMTGHRGKATKKTITAVFATCPAA
jgi:hypothetical protein